MASRPERFNWPGDTSIYPLGAAYCSDRLLLIWFLAKMALAADTSELQLRDVATMVGMAAIKTLTSVLALMVTMAVSIWPAAVRALWVISFHNATSRAVDFVTPRPIAASHIITCADSLGGIQPIVSPHPFIKIPTLLVA